MLNLFLLLRISRILIKISVLKYYLFKKKKKKPTLKDVQLKEGEFFKNIFLVYITTIVKRILTRIKWKITRFKNFFPSK